MQQQQQQSLPPQPPPTLPAYMNNQQKYSIHPGPHVRQQQSQPIQINYMPQKQGMIGALGSGAQPQFPLVNQPGSESIPQNPVISMRPHDKTQYFHATQQQPQQPFQQIPQRMTLQQQQQQQQLQNAQRQMQNSIQHNNPTLGQFKQQMQPNTQRRNMNTQVSNSSREAYDEHTNMEENIAKIIKGITSECSIDNIMVEYERFDCYVSCTYNSCELQKMRMMYDLAKDADDSDDENE